MFLKENWRPVEIGRSLISGNLEGLIGIEECTDYGLNSIITSEKEPQINILKGAKRSRQKDKPPKKRRKSKLSDEKLDSEVNLFAPSRNGNTVGTIGETDKIADSPVSLESWREYQLSDLILRALADLGFTYPTYIQALTLPAAILGKRDILGAAETGSGKTLAFGIPILSGILRIKETEKLLEGIPPSVDPDLSDSEESDFETVMEANETGCVRSVNEAGVQDVGTKCLYALILTPTRELAIQVKNHLEAIAKYTGIRVAVVVGGLAAVKQERILEKGPEIVVATPGRLWELIQQGNSHLSQIDAIRFLAIDETDRMLERGHFRELRDLLERINLDDARRRKRQNFVFSATLTLVHELPNYLRNKKKMGNSRNINDMTAAQKLQKIVDLLGISNPKVVDVTEGKGTSETLTECKITCAFDEKDYYVYYFLKRHPGRTLIFCNSIGCVKRVSTLLGMLGFQPLPLHASMQQRQRLRNLERGAQDGILVATDVAARGLDVPCVEHVLHYQIPRTSEGYVHRSGRTARASRQGLTLLLVEPNELPNYLKLCRTLDKSQDIPVFPVQQNYLKAVKERVNLARELDKLELLVRKTNSEAGWFQKMANDMDILVDDFTERIQTDESRQAKKAADIKRKHLATLLSKPIITKELDGRFQLSSELLNGGIKSEKAVDIMKSALEADVKEKKRKSSLYKPQRHGLKGKKNSGFKEGRINVGKVENAKNSGRGESECLPYSYELLQDKFLRRTCRCYSFLVQSDTE